MSIKGRNSVANLPKFELIQAFMYVLLACKNANLDLVNDNVYTKFGHILSIRSQDIG